MAVDSQQDNECRSEGLKSLLTTICTQTVKERESDDGMQGGIEDTSLLFNYIVTSFSERTHV